MQTPSLEQHNSSSDDSESQAIQWVHAGHQRELALEVSVSAMTFAAVAVGFCLQALYFHHWILAGLLGGTAMVAAWLFKRSRAQAVECHNISKQYQASLGELGWYDIKSADPMSTHPRLKQEVLEAAAQNRTARPMVTLQGQNGEHPTVNEVRRIQAAALDLEEVAHHDALMQVRFKAGVLLTSILLAWAGYGLVTKGSFSGVLLCVAVVAAMSTLKAKGSSAYLDHGSKEDRLEFLDWYGVRTRYDANRSHLELVTDQGTLLDPYSLKGVVPGDDV